MSVGSIAINILAFVSFAIYTLFRLDKIYKDFNEEGGKPHVYYYFPVAAATATVFIYGVVYTLWPLIIMSCIEFVFSAFAIALFSCKGKNKMIMRM